MRSLIIRDDDLSFWTNPDEIEEIYGKLFDQGIKVSFATIPYAVRMYNAGNFDKFYQDENSSTPIGENRQIVEYIKQKIKSNHVEIMLHGYTHLYAFKHSGSDKIYKATKENLDISRQKVVFLGEYNYQDFDSLFYKTKEAKEYLEDLFCVKIKNFVPPSNQINKNGIKAINKNNLNLSGMIERSYNRAINPSGIFSYLKRVGFKLQNKNITYPYMMDYKTHKELCGYALTPATNMQKYYKQINYSKEKNLPFQLATHYWELNDELRDKFYEVVEFARENGFETKFLKEVLK